MLEPDTRDWNRLADRRARRRAHLTRDDARAVLRAPDDVLLDQLAAAYRVRRHYYGNRVRLHFLLNAQSGLCPEDCHYCSQSAVSTAEIEKYPFMAREKILAAADRAASFNVGHVLHGDLRSRAGRARLRQGARRGARGEARHDMHVCACLGLLTEDHVRRLEEAGVDAGQPQPEHARSASTDEIVHDAHVRRPRRDGGARARGRA